MNQDIIQQPPEPAQGTLSSAGENYHYIKTIVNNHVEIKKLELLQSGSQVLGKTILFAILAVLIGLSCLILLVLGIILLAYWIGSWPWACAYVAGALLLIAFIIYIARNALIFRPIESKMINLVESE